MNPLISRRKFLSSCAAAAAALSLPAKSYARVLGANERIRMGFIGAGNMANQHFAALLPIKQSNNLDFVAVSDCWKRRAKKGASRIKAAKAYSDYRPILDDKNIDYVTIAVPEHTHCRITLDALDAGKAVYCEKPLTHTIAEAQLVLQKQRHTGLPLQMGVQGMSDDSYSSAAKAIEEGLIGQVVHAQLECVRRYDQQGAMRSKDLDPQMRQPKDLDWKAWLGDAPQNPWNPHHYFEWRCYSSYSGGIAGDLFIHRITRMMKACNLLFPSRVVGMGGIYQWKDGRDLPDNFEMICEYPRGMTVYVLGTMSNRVPIDHLIRGYRGTLYFTETGWVAKDKDDQVLETFTKTTPEDIGVHHTNLHNHLRHGEPLTCPVEFSVAATAAVCMANESWRTGAIMAWDESQQDMVPATSQHSTADRQPPATLPQS